MTNDLKELIVKQVCTNKTRNLRCSSTKQKSENVSHCFKYEITGQMGMQLTSVIIKKIQLA